MQFTLWSYHQANIAKGTEARRTSHNLKLPFSNVYNEPESNLNIIALSHLFSIVHSIQAHYKTQHKCVKILIINNYHILFSSALSLYSDIN